MPMYVPSAYASLSASMLHATKAVSANKLFTLAGNTSWLYEGFLASPAGDNPNLSIPITFDHTGGGKGRPLPVIMNLPRPYYIDKSDFTSAITITGDGSWQSVAGIVSSFQFGEVDSDAGYNWALSTLAMFLPHRYALNTKTRIAARLASGSEAGAIRGVIYANATSFETLLVSEAIGVSNSGFTIFELTAGLQDIAENFSEAPTRPCYFGLQAWAAHSTTLEIKDTEITAATLAVTSEAN